LNLLRAKNEEKAAEKDSASEEPEAKFRQEKGLHPLRQVNNLTVKI